MLAGCASPYEKGKSAADVPANIDAIYLQQVYVADLTINKPDLAAETTPSKDSLEMLNVVKPSVVNQLTNFGYKIVEDSHEKADIAMKCGVRYHGYWPLSADLMYTWCKVYDLSGAPIFQFFAVDQRGLIDYALGPTISTLAAKEARDTVIKVVNEMRKGTKAAPVHAAAIKKEGV